MENIQFINDDDNIIDIDEPFQTWTNSIREPQLEFDDTEVQNSVPYDIENEYNDGLLNEKLDLELTEKVDALQFFDENYEDQIKITPIMDMGADSKAIDNFSDMVKYNIINVTGDDKYGRKIIIISACNLPTRDKMDYNRFLKYITTTLDTFVELDYVIVYFHCGLNSKNKPPMSWLWQAYKMFDHKYKKNLKQLYLVHPTNFVKIFYQIFKPAISNKFGHKIVKINFLYELQTHMLIEQLYIPKLVLEHDSKLYINYKNTINNSNLFEDHICENALFGEDIKDLAKRNNDPIPIFVKQIVEHLSTKESLSTVGLFRRSCNINSLNAIKQRLNNGAKLKIESTDDAHLYAVLLKSFLRDLPSPLFTFENYDKIINSESKSNIQTPIFCRDIIDTLPKENYALIKYIINFLKLVTTHSDINKMTSHNLGLIFGPNFIWAKTQPSLINIDRINNFITVLISYSDEIFDII